MISGFRFRVLLPCAAAVLLPAAAASAQTDAATLSASIGTLARLTLSTATVSFPDADPDIVSQIPASGGPVSITVKGRATRGSQVLLTVQAEGNLRSGLDTIDARQITWTATGAGFADGTLSSTSPVTVGRWVGSGTHTGTQAFVFQNLWTYATGMYSLTMTYTLTAP